MAAKFPAGYLGTITIRDRGVVPRGMKQAFNAASKQAWRETGQYFHDHLRDKRFTPEHAREAGYTRRKGERMPFGSKQWRSQYTGKKFSMHGHTNPLQFGGDTRRAVATQYRITSTSKGARVAYSGARVFNFRHPKSQVRMSQEFKRIIPREVTELARVFDQHLDQLLNN